MFTHCIVCHAPFPENVALEHLPRGDRVAYDPGRGRLWAVCRGCKRWSLVPMEARWEALEELERLVTADPGARLGPAGLGGARLLSQTDNVSLLKAGELEIVRVGRADLTEEAWWRYGRELRQRKRSYDRIALAGTVAAGAAMLGGWATGSLSLIGAWFLWGNAPEGFTDAARWLSYGTAAWRGTDACARCGHAFGSIAFRDRGGFHLVPRDAADHALVYRCPTCGAYRDGGLHLTGSAGDRVLRRVLAWTHYSGASEERVRSATRLIEEAGSPGDLKRIVVRDGKRLGDLQRTGAIALEIAANESAEQRLLEMELVDLEAHWRVEEELASIVDGELTPLPLLEQVRRKVTGR